MNYTVRYAHLADTPKLKIGDTLKAGDIIGVMGSSGQSTAIHLHIDCVEGVQNRPYTLMEMMKTKKPSKKQLDYFIDEELFGVPIVITTQYMDKAYRAQFGKDHPAYDVVPEDRHRTSQHFFIHWNRSKEGIVSKILYQPESYGHVVYVTFSA